MTTRETSRDRFIEESGWDPASCKILAADASFRQYFRLGAPTSAVLMDAPPDKEDIVPFVAVSDYLRARGLASPNVLAADFEDGFLILEDFGDAKFTGLLEKADEAEEAALYREAVEVLIDLHREVPGASLPIPAHTPYPLPAFDDALLLEEAFLFTDWYLPALTGADLGASVRAEFEACWRAAFEGLRAQPQCLVMRDYHVDNLMLQDGREGLRRVGLLDFQDAVVGPVAYDLVSLLQDARRDVPPAIEEAMIAVYLDAYPQLERDEFAAAYAVLGAQRNAKIIGIFTRLWKRDGKPRYLSIIPRVWGLLERDLAHPALSGVKAWFDGHVPTALRVAPNPDTGADGGGARS